MHPYPKMNMVPGFLRVPQMQQNLVYSTGFFFLPLVALVEVPILKHGLENLKTHPKL